MAGYFGVPRGRLRATSLAILLGLAAATGAQAEDYSIVGDWRFVGQDAEFGYGFNLADVRREGSQATVAILRTALAGGPVSHEITTTVIDCEARTYRVTGVMTYGEDDSLPPSRARDDGPYPLAGPPQAVAGPVCQGVPQLTPGNPVSAKTFSTGVREYINSGAAAWEEANPRS